MIEVILILLKDYILIGLMHFVVLAPLIHIGGIKVGAMKPTLEWYFQFLLSVVWMWPVIWFMVPINIIKKRRNRSE